tara:strand:+ start:62 stop:163 length:102 start_codon:yes stop_codon:yes gene_type:complete
MDSKDLNRGKSVLNEKLWIVVFNLSLLNRQKQS